MAIRSWGALKHSPGGAIVFMSGSSAVAPKASLAAVGAINAAIAALANAFAERGVADGVQVNAVLPGPVMTSRRHSLLKRFAAENGLSFEAGTERLASETGISRYGQARRHRSAHRLPSLAARTLDDRCDAAYGWR